MLTTLPPARFAIWVRLLPSLPYWLMQTVDSDREAQFVAAAWLAHSGPHAQVAVQLLVELEKKRD